MITDPRIRIYKKWRIRKNWSELSLTENRGDQAEFFYPCFIEQNSKFVIVYNFFEVSEHNHESPQTWGFCMDFLNHREGVWFSIRFSSFLPYSVQ